MRCRLGTGGGLRAGRARRGLGVAGRDLLLRRAGSHLRLELRELVVHLRGGRDLRELAVELRLVACAEVLERAGGGELVDRRCARLHLLGLVLGPLDGQPGVLHVLADPGRGLADLDLGLGGRVLRLQDLLLGAEGFDAGLELLLGGDELLLLVLELVHLPVHVLQLRLRERLALERLPREVLAVRRHRLACLGLELDDVLLELLLLQLEPFLRGDDVGGAALHVLQLLEHLLVRVVERLGRVLRPVQQLRVLRLDDRRRP